MIRTPFRLLPLFVAVLLLPSRVYAQVQDSLGRLYVSAIAAGRHLIVDQGRYKAIFNAAGRPLTPFIYKDLRPGLDGRFLARIEHRLALIDSFGTELALLAGVLDAVDTAAQFYRTRDHSSLRFYNADGSLSAVIPAGYGQDTGRLFVWTHDGYGLQGVIDASNRVVLPREYVAVQIGDAAIAARKGDSAYVFDLNGRLRFRTLAQDHKLLPGGALGVKLYGLWGILDSTGELLRPFSAYSLEFAGRSRFVLLNRRLQEATGAEPASDPINYIDDEPGGWYGVHYEGESREEIRDAGFKVVLPKGSFGRLEYIGPRIILVYADYNDRLPQVYDRNAMLFRDSLPVERHIAGDAYLLYDARTKTRRILKGDSMLKLPRFTALEAVAGAGYFRITRDDSAVPGFRQTPASPDHGDLEGFIRAQCHAETLPYGLLDSGMRLIVPLSASEIRMLTGGLIYAGGRDGKPGAIHRANGTVLMRVPPGSRVSVGPDLIRIAGPEGCTLLDTLGRVFYRGAECPSVLVPDPQAASEKEAEPLRISNGYDAYPVLKDLMDERLDAGPRLLLYDDSSGYSGLYDIDGRQLLPHQYYAVAQRVPGLHSLKRGDSVYFVNAHGRLLYGGRGFSGRHCHILENYDLLMRAGNGRWGSLDATGNVRVPFVYDSVHVFRQTNEPAQYTVVRDGRYGILDRNGSLLYPPQPWKPRRWVSSNLVEASDGMYYRLTDEAVMPLSADSVRAILDGNRSQISGPFLIRSQQGAGASGIYSRQSGALLAPWYRSFQYRESRGRMMITNERRTQIAVIDSAGELVMPFTDNPAVLVMADSALLLMDTGRERLYYNEGRRQRRLDVHVDSAVRARLLANYRGPEPYVSNGELVPFRLSRGGWGVMNHRGTVLIDREISEIRTDGYHWRVRRGKHWGLLMPYELRYIHPPDADSILKPRGSEHFSIRKAGRTGLYNASAGIYLPPVYTQIYQPATLANGYLMVRTPDGYTFVDRSGRQIAPFFDSLNITAPTIPATAAYENGAEVSLAIGVDGRILVERGLDAKIRRAGIDGSYAPVVVLRIGKKFGLYSNERFRMILPAQYDAIDAGLHGFVAWKYKPDKHQGMDSTLLLDLRGHLIRAMKGGFNPVQDEGFWYLRGHGYSPVLDVATKEIIPDGYRVQREQRVRYFLLEKGGKRGIVSDSGAWLTPMIFDRIIPEISYSPENRVGRITVDGRVKEALIDRNGRQVTAPVYDGITFDDRQIRFRRGTLKGYLDETGRELQRPAPENAHDSD